MLYTKIQAVTVSGLSAEQNDFWSCRKQFSFHWYTTVTILRRTESREQNVSPFKALMKLIQRTERKKTSFSPLMAPRFSFSIQCIKGKVISLDQRFSFHLLSQLKNYESHNNIQISLLKCLLLLALHMKPEGKAEDFIPVLPTLTAQWQSTCVRASTSCLTNRELP